MPSQTTTLVNQQAQDMKATPFPICECTDVVYLGSPLVGPPGLNHRPLGGVSDCFSVEAVHSKPWPAPPLYRPPSHLPNDGLSAGPGAPHKK